MKRIIGMYFSGTGTTEKVVKKIGRTLQEEWGIPYESMDFTPPMKRKEHYLFGEGDLVILGVPVIAGRVPNLLLPFLNTLEGQGAMGVPVVLYGNRNFDDALIELRNIMQEREFLPVGGGAFVGEHSFSKTLGKGRPDKEDEKDILAFAMALKEKMEKGAPYPPLYVKGRDPIGPYYTPRDRYGKGIDIRKVKPKTNLACDQCGLCVSLCPLGSIDPGNCKDIIGICMKCCACIKKCPKEAKYFDDEGYIYHKEELEEMYGGERNSNDWFV